MQNAKHTRQDSREREQYDYDPLNCTPTNSVKYLRHGSGSA